MEGLSRVFLGDKLLWAFIGLLGIFSFLPVYSASSNLEYIVGNGSTTSHLVKHALFLFMGIGIIIFMQLVDYRYLGGMALIGLPIAIVALAITLLQRDTIGGVEASRWLRIPFIGLRFQTSTFASVILLVYIARYLTKIRSKHYSFWDTVLPLHFPIILVIGLIFPANASTAAILFTICMIMLFIGDYPIKYLGIIFVTILLAAAGFIFTAKNTDLIPNNRVSTWESRIERFMDGDSEESYQVKHAKAAIVSGGQLGKGPGKSALKQTLPQSSSDFIFAIIVEEYGSMMGGGFIIFIFLLILYRIMVIATKIHTIFGTLLTFAVGLPIVFQAFVNIGVAVNLFPVTGQPLPMISYGGTSLWITCLSFGIIISVSRSIKSKEEIEKERKKNGEAYIQDIA